ncbi:MFS transporter, partial [Micromonospora zhanjiangensis]
GTDREKEAPAEQSERSAPAQRAPAAPRRRHPSAWEESDIPEESPSFAIYRPDSAGEQQPVARPEPRVRSEAR